LRLEGTYNTHDYLSERRAALETWTALLLDIESGAQKVTPITRSSLRKVPQPAMPTRYRPAHLLQRAALPPATFIQFL
jgi:hypothetical protein